MDFLRFYSEEGKSIDSDKQVFAEDDEQQISCTVEDGAQQKIS